MAKQKLKLTWQRDILRCMVRDKEIVSKCRGVVKPKYFTTVPYKWLCKKIYEHYEKYNGAVFNKKSYLIELKNDIREVDERRAYMKVLSRIYKEKKIVSKDHVIDNVYDWAEIQSFGLLLNRAARFGESGEIEKAKDAIRSSFLFGLETQDIIVCDFTEDWKQRQRKRKERKSDEGRKQVKFRLGPLDNICQIFTDTSSLVVLAATSGVGKSIWSVNVGSNAFLDDIRIAHFIFENVIDQVVGRYDSRLLGYPYRDIMRHKWKKSSIKKARKKMKELRRKFQNNLKIFHFPIDTCNVPRAEAILRELEISEGWVPQVIIYDSMDHMTPSEKQEGHRLNVSKVYKDGKRQSEIRNIPVITTSHAKASERHQIVRQEGFSESYDKPRLSDVWLTISQTVEQEDSREALILLDKNRDDEGNLKMLVDLMYSVMTIRFKEVIE